jgi:AcrR family transcriptional regulator
MMSMSISYVATGRTGQKARTRDALVTAARDLIAQAVNPTVEQAAAAAGISRATAYRYFANQRALLVAAHPEIDRASLLGSDPPADPMERLELVLDEFIAMVLDTEPALRAALRLSLEPQPKGGEGATLRKGRAIGWLEEALEPLEGRLSPAELRTLVLGIRSIAGIEALVWLTDVAGLTRKQAAETMRASARALLRDALVRAA